MHVLKAIILTLAVIVASAALAQGRRDLDSSRLIGAPVYSADGAEIGTIVDLRLDEAGRVAAVRIEVGARLGFGARRVQLPGNSLSVIRGTAVVDLPKEAVEMLPTVEDLPTGANNE
jgi:sporulation protein YlmC with PRC-barrel domain